MPPAHSSDPSECLAEARTAIEAYEYDRARELLERALELSGGGVAAAQLLLELLVDVLGLDGDALALEPRLSRAARREGSVRCRLALAAARSGDAARALGWLEALDEPEAAGALLECARHELSAGKLEQCQALLDRVRRIDPAEPRLAELERALREEKRFRVLLLEEELDALIAEGRAEAAREVARALLARDGRNAKAARLLEQGEAARAEARARELLGRLGTEPPPAADLERRAQQLRAASAARLGPELREELSRAAGELEARAAEERARAALADFVARWQVPAIPTAELVHGYLSLPDVSRRRAREQTGDALFAWIDALALPREPARAVVRGLDALRKASALEQQNPEAALALLEPELGALRRLSEAAALRARLTERIAAARRAAATHGVEMAERALQEGAPERALELVTQLPRAALEVELRARAEEVSLRAERALAQERLERSVRMHREQGRPLEARRALDELIGSGWLAAEAQARAVGLRGDLEAEVRRHFAVEHIPAPLGDWWRALVSRSVLEAVPHVWVSPSSGWATIPVVAGRWVLLVQLRLGAGSVRGALLLRLPRAVSAEVDATLRGSELTLLSDEGEGLALDVNTGHVSSWEEGYAPPDRIVESCWLSRDPRRLWLELRRRASDAGQQSVRVVDRQSRRILAEFDGRELTRVLGHAEADAIVTHRGRYCVVDAAGRPLAWRPPEGCSGALVHPRGHGLIVSEVDYGDTGELLLHELGTGQHPRTTEVEGMSGEALHTIGVSRQRALVAVLGYSEGRELFAYRATERGLELAWRRACGAAPLLLTDASCEELYVLRAEAGPDGGWLSRVEETPIDFPHEDEGDLELDGLMLHGFEPWRCTAPASEGQRAGEPALEGPARHAPSAVLDEFVRRQPRDYWGLRRLWSRWAQLAHEQAADASGLELERLTQAHPRSGAVRLLAAHESADDGRWGEVRRLLRGVAVSDVEARDARHLCHLQALCCLMARDLSQARTWIEEGLRHEGWSCALAQLALAVEPLPVSIVTRPARAELAPEGRAGEAVVWLRCLLRELDALLDADPWRLLDHPALHRAEVRSPQVLARQASAWLRLEANGPELRARRLLELARFCAALHPLDLATRELFFPEAWPLEELLALRDRAQHALGEQAGTTSAVQGEPQARPPALPHEVAARDIPGFEELLAGVLRRGEGPPSELEPRWVDDAELLDLPLVRKFLAAEVKRHMLHGSPRRAARQRVRALTALLVASANHGLGLRKTFWVDDALSAKLRHTQLDIRGAVLNLPFPCCAFVLTEPAVLALARELVRLDPSWRGTERIAVVTAYLMRSEDGPASTAGGSATLRVCLAISPWEQAVPWVLVRELRLDPEADLDAILDSHLKDAVERELDPWLGSEALRQVLALILNAVLYATSAEARPQPLPALPRRAPGERLVLSGEGVFYLPDRIEIQAGASGDPDGALESSGAAPPGRTIQHRVAVRGHWRRPPAQASDPRLRWVRPHFRGPRDAVLVEREYRLGAGTTGAPAESDGGADPAEPASLDSSGHDGEPRPG